MNHKNFRVSSWLVFALMSLGIFLKITSELFEDSKLRRIDDQILLAIAKLREPWISGPMVDITALGSVTLLTIFSTAIVLFLWKRKDQVAALYFSFGVIGAGLWSKILKSFFERPRPSVVDRLVEVSSYSYPSGHSLASTSFYLLLMFLFFKKLQSWKERLYLACFMWFIIISIAFSRLYLGVHFPTDVVSGICFGAAWVFFLTGIFSKYANLDVIFINRS